MTESKTIFLAHAAEDKPFVRQLHQALKQQGFSPWLDEEDLIPGVQWDNEIKRVIKNARIFIACISNKSINKTGYIQKELRFALSILEQKPPGSIYFIPALIEDVELPDITVGTVNLSEYHAIKIFNSKGMDKLMQTLKNQISPAQDTTPASSRTKRTIDTQSLRELIAKGNIEKALKSLTQYFLHNNDDFDNQTNVSMLSARYKKVEKDNTFGIISSEYYGMERNKITHATLSILKDLENQ